MLKNRIWLGIILSIILLIFSTTGLAVSYYKYTQESGDLFYVGTGDKADALEDTNEMRQIIDDLGALLVHSKRDDLYPKDSTTGGTIQIPEAGLKFSNDPVNDDIAAYIAGEMAWQTKAELGLDLSLYYLKTEIDSLSEVETIYTKDITDSDELASALTLYYLKTAIDTIGEVETIWIKDITDSTELASALADYYLKTAIDTQGEIETIWGVTLANDSELHTQNTDTDLDATFEATFVKKADTVNVLSDITSPGADIEDAVTKKHSQNTDTQFDFYNALGSDHLYSGDIDTQPVGESVVFGDLLYFNWTDKEWKKTDADAEATMPGLRIALESKTDGQTCLMLVKGYIRDDSAFEFTGSMVYTSVTPGAMSSTAPMETGDQVQRVGVAKSADILFFNPSIDVGEI